ncbi:MAG: NAD-dependent epimerase/dehydratase family protein [Actinomycetota bacterium]|nr:NAD-dependent epimerase/dehydratase family protein [Actinomycetota bacterium]
MKVVVTGSSGAVGRRACARLAEEGYEVLGLDRRSSIAPSGVEVRTVDLAVTDLRAALAGADTVIHLAAGVRANRSDPGGEALALAERLLVAAGHAGVRHLIVRSSATVYGAWPDNPVPLTEDAPVRPCPDFPFAVHRAKLEDLARDWADLHPSRLTTFLRPVVTVAEEHTGGLGRTLTSAMAVGTQQTDPLGQFLHADDLAEAVVCSVSERVDGPLNVSPDGWISAGDMADLGGPVRRLRLPPLVAATTIRLLWQAGLSGAPPGAAPYTVWPWVVSNDRLRELGWKPQHSNEEAYVVSHGPSAVERLNARARQRISLSVAGALLIGMLSSVVWLLRRARHR